MEKEVIMIAHRNKLQINESIETCAFLITPFLRTPSPLPQNRFMILIHRSIVLYR